MVRHRKGMDRPRFCRSHRPADAEGNLEKNSMTAAVGARDATAYWSQVPRQWGTSTTTTGTARMHQTPEEAQEMTRGVVLIVSLQYPTVSLRAHHILYKLAGLSKMSPHLFILESPAGIELSSTTRAAPRAVDADPSAWRGVFTMKTDRRTLFSASVEVRTNTLRRWKPQIIIDRRTLEREDA